MYENWNMLQQKNNLADNGVQRRILPFKTVPFQTTISLTDSHDAVSYKITKERRKNGA
jgi:hypothetical protein